MGDRAAEGEKILRQPGLFLAKGKQEREAMTRNVDRQSEPETGNQNFSNGNAKRK